MTTDSAHRLHPHLVETRLPGVAVLRIEREDALGALSRDILLTLRAYLGDLARDPSVRVLILTGTGRGFIAGADIGEYDGASQADFIDYQLLGRETFDAVAALPQFTIAAVNGYALGGGFEVALCCDLILAAERARFGLPEVKLGLLPGGGGTQRLSRAAGTRFTKELVVTGRFASAAELHARGVVSRVCPADELMDAAYELAATIAAQAPLAVRAAKPLIDEGVTMALPDALTREQAVLAELYGSADGKEGVAAFIAKRAPEFQGR